MGYPGYPPGGPYPPRPSPWPWILGALVVVAALAVGVIAAGIFVVTQRDKNTEAATVPPPSAQTIAATNAPPEAAVDPQAAAFATLRARADSDRPFVSANLSERWVPQISAKRTGLVAPDVDGRVVTWTNTEILAQHQRLRQQYPGTRLIWSDEWNTFDLRGWWVTLAGATFAEPDSANAWCDAMAISADECFAKLVSNSRGPAGTTKYR